MASLQRDGVRLPGQQAGLKKGGSKLPHSRALRAFSCTAVSLKLAESSIMTANPEEGCSD